MFRDALKKRKPVRNENWRNLGSDLKKLGLNLPVGSESDRYAMGEGLRSERWKVKA